MLTKDKRRYYTHLAVSEIFANISVAAEMHPPSRQIERETEWKKETVNNNSRGYCWKSSNITNREEYEEEEEDVGEAVWLRRTTAKTYNYVYLMYVIGEWISLCCCRRFAHCQDSRFSHKFVVLLLLLLVLVVENEYKYWRNWVNTAILMIAYAGE